MIENETPRKADLVGFVRILDLRYAFVLPVFSAEGYDAEIFVQEISGDDIVTRLGLIDLNGIEMHAAPERRTIEVSQQALLAFEAEDREYYIGFAEEMRVSLANLRSRQALAKNPFTRSRIAAFCGDSEAELADNIEALQAMPPSATRNYFKLNILARDRIRSLIPRSIGYIPFKIQQDLTSFTITVPQSVDDSSLKIVNDAMSSARVDLIRILGSPDLKTRCRRQSSIAEPWADEASPIPAIPTFNRLQSLMSSLEQFVAYLPLQWGQGILHGAYTSEHSVDLINMQVPRLLDGAELLDLDGLADALCDIANSLMTGMHQPPEFEAVGSCVRLLTELVWFVSDISKPYYANQIANLLSYGTYYHLNSEFRQTLLNTMELCFSLRDTPRRATRIEGFKAARALAGIAWVTLGPATGAEAYSSLFSIFSWEWLAASAAHLGINALIELANRERINGKPVVAGRIAARAVVELENRYGVVNSNNLPVTGIGTKALLKIVNTFKRLSDLLYGLGDINASIHGLRCAIGILEIGSYGENYLLLADNYKLLARRLDAIGNRFEGNQARRKAIAWRGLQLKKLWDKALQRTDRTDLKAITQQIYAIYSLQNETSRVDGQLEIYFGDEDILTEILHSAVSSTEKIKRLEPLVTAILEKRSRLI